MSVAASSYAAALRSTRPVAVRKPKPHVPLPQLSDVEAAQELVRQLHAIVYGYQLAIGRLTDRSAQAVAVAATSRAPRILLDALPRRWSPGARPYPPPSRPTNRG